MCQCCRTFLKYVFPCLLALWFRNVVAQPSINIGISDTVCIDEPLTIFNNSENVQKHEWNFCTGSLANEPTADNLSGNFQGPFI